MNKDKDVKKVVKEGYGKIAKKGSCCCSTNLPCCGTPNIIEDVSKKVGYTEEDLTSIPEGANLGLGCGNPVALASLKEGDNVVDLGSGAGFDCFLASKRVGSTGKIIGVDMTPEMIEKARLNAAKGSYNNVEFRLGEIESIPVEDNFADIVISNCVINLSPDKDKVFNEAFRIIKPGGKLMVSDIVLLKELPDFIKESSDAYVACLAGAIMKEDYLGKLKSAGFTDINVLEETPYPIDIIANESTANAIIDNLEIPADKLNEVQNSIISIKVRAEKLL